MTIGAKYPAFTASCDAGLNLLDCRRIVLAEDFCLCIHRFDKARTDGEDFNSLSAEGFFAENLTAFHIGRGLRWRNAAHYCNLIKNIRAKRQPQHSGQTLLCAALNLLVDQTHVW